MLRMLGKGVRTVRDRLRSQGVRTTALWAYARGIPKVTGVPMLEHSRVTEALYVGPQHRANGKRALMQAGITHIVNMRAEFDDAEHGLTLNGTHTANYCHLPTIDDDPISAAHIREGIAFIERALAQGGKVYIHCTAGVGRAPSLAAAYLISKGCSVDEALNRIRAARPFIKPTPAQLRALAEFERETNANGSANRRQ